MQGTELEDRASLEYRAGLVCRLGCKLAQAGSETRHILQSMHLLARVLHLKDVQCGVNRTGTVVAVSSPSGEITVFSKVLNFGINMSQVNACHQLCLKSERNEFASVEELAAALNAIGPVTYPRWLLIALNAVAGAAFAYLNGGSQAVCLSALLGAFIVMTVRFFLSARGYFDSFAYMVSAFSGSLTAVLLSHALGEGTAGVTLALMATSLILVPGFPFLHGFLDLFKGYIENGITRLVQATVLILSAATGVLGVILLISVKGVM